MVAQAAGGDLHILSTIKASSKSLVLSTDVHSSTNHLMILCDYSAVVAVDSALENAGKAHAYDTLDGILESLKSKGHHALGRIYNVGDNQEGFVISISEVGCDALSETLRDEFTSALATERSIAEIKQRGETFRRPLGATEQALLMGSVGRP